MEEMVYSITYHFKTLEARDEFESLADDLVEQLTGERPDYIEEESDDEPLNGSDFQ